MMEMSRASGVPEARGFLEDAGGRFLVPTLPRAVTSQTGLSPPDSPPQIKATMMRLRAPHLLPVALFLPIALSAQAAAPAPTVEWRAGPSITGPRDHHVVFSVEGSGGAFLYTAGGTDYRQMLGN